MRTASLVLPIALLIGLAVADVPIVCIDNAVTQHGFRDLTGTISASDDRYICGLGLGFIPSKQDSLPVFQHNVLSDVRGFTRRVLLYDFFLLLNYQMSNSILHHQSSESPTQIGCRILSGFLVQVYSNIYKIYTNAQLLLRVLVSIVHVGISVSDSAKHYEA